MRKEQIIFAGIGLIVLNVIAMYFDLHVTDKVFWFVFAPLGFTLGMAVKHLCQSR